MRAKHKKRREQFAREAIGLLESLGAVAASNGDPWPIYLLKTPAGQLRLSIHTGLYLIDAPWFRDGDSPWIAGRFEDVAAAKNLLGNEVNPYSGKWNHHCWNNWTDDFKPGLAVLEYNLRRILEQL